MDETHGHADRRKAGVRCQILTVVTVGSVEVADQARWIRPGGVHEGVEPILGHHATSSGAQPLAVLARSHADLVLFGRFFETQEEIDRAADRRVCAT